MDSKKIGAITAIIGTIIAICTFLWGSGILNRGSTGTPPIKDTNSENNRSGVVSVNAPNSNNETNNTAEKPNEPQRIKQGNLFDLPIYSETDYYKNSLDHCFSFCSSVEDARGYKHNDCYVIKVHSGNRSWIRYELNGNYKTLCGTFYRDKPSFSGYSDASWIEIYDGDEWIYTTDKLTENNQTIELNLDISGVQYLTLYFRSESDLYVADIIADPLTIN